MRTPQKWRIKKINISEAPPDYHFTKKLAKQYSSLPGEEISMQCTLNSYKASVRWWKEYKHKPQYLKNLIFFNFRVFSFVCLGVDIEVLNQ